MLDLLGSPFHFCQQIVRFFAGPLAPGNLFARSIALGLAALGGGNAFTPFAIQRTEALEIYARAAIGGHLLEVRQVLAEVVEIMHGRTGYRNLAAQETRPLPRTHPARGWATWWTVYPGGGYHGIYTGMEQTLPLAISSPAQGDDEFLWGFWYPVLRSNRIRGRRLVTSARLEVPLVLGRDGAGKAFALRDVCPHRAFPLSLGRYDGHAVECAYHGWRFEAHTGQCRLVPSITEDSKLQCDRIHAGSFPCEERDGYVWAYFANPEGRSPGGCPPPPVPELPKYSGRYRIAHLSATLDCSMDTAIIGLMDPAHGPFVHRSWWWRSRRSVHEKAKAFAPSPWGFTMTRHAPSSNSRAYRLLGGAPQTEISFRLPGIRIEHIRAGKHVLCNLTAVTPIDDGATEVNHVIYWTMPWLGPLRPLLRLFVRKFLHQDRDIVALQQRGLRHAPPLLLINDADSQAKWYYRLKQEYARARVEGRDFVNPIKPRVLRW